jgi:hypothetical protein
MAGIAQWAVPTAERRRLRFPFQNQQCQRAGLSSRAAARKINPPTRSAWSRPAIGSAVSSDPRFPCQPPSCRPLQSNEPPGGEERGVYRSRSPGSTAFVQIVEAFSASVIRQTRNPNKRPKSPGRPLRASSNSELADHGLAAKTEPKAPAPAQRTRRSESPYPNRKAQHYGAVRLIAQAENL